MGGNGSGDHLGRTGAWSKPELDSLVEMYEIQKLPFAEIKDHFPGRSTRHCRKRYHQFCQKRDGLLTKTAIEGPETFVVDEAALIAREQRNEGYMARDLTSTVCGDPPRGFSALDLQRESA